MTGAAQPARGAAAPAWRSPSRGGRRGNGFFVVLVRAGGLALAPFFLCFVALWFLAAAGAARRVSFDLARRLGRGRTLPGRLWFALRHFYTFGMLQLDRIAILGAGQAGRYRFDIVDEERIRETLAQGRGLVFLTAHLGNWSVMGHMVAGLGLPIHMVMFDAVDEALRAMTEDMARDRSFAVLYTDGSPGSAAAMLAALRRGEILGMMGDRVVAGEAQEAELLGAKVRLPVGAFVIAAAAGAPVVQVVGLRVGWRHYRFHAAPARWPAWRGRRHRGEDLRRAAQEFADGIEPFLREHPWQWGNFFPFFLDR